MIEVSNLSFRYGKKQILENIGFAVKSGERVAIIGKNGCGKSTLLQVMAGVTSPASGSVQYFGVDILKERKRIRDFCGYVPQGNPLMEELTVYDNLRLWNQGKKDIPDTVIEMNGLQDFLYEKVYKLSGGMKRRVGIACGMLNLPPVILMDEPTTALDLFYREQIHEWMKEYQRMNGTLVIVTHDKEEIEASDKVYEITDGKLIVNKENTYERGI